MAAHPRGGFSIKSFTRKDYRTLLYIGLIELVATTAFYAAIEVSPNPAIPSFLRNLEYLFVSVLGFILLSERFGKVALAGAFLALLGAFIVSLRTTSAQSFITAASGLMLLSTSFYAVRTVLAKKHIREISPVVLSVNRAIFLFLFSLIIMISGTYAFRIPANAFFNIVVGSFVGPFLTSIFSYSALRYIEASRAAIIQSSTGLFVLIGAFLIFGNLPTAIQVFGGIVTMTGVILMMLNRLK